MTSKHEELLQFWLSQGWAYRRRQNPHMQREPKRYAQRMKMEYNVIRSIPGYVDYFLMTSDLVRWAKDRGIMVGPGRGSAAGSLVCYLTRITEIDSLQYPMLFERFISTDRTDLPDIDLDFEDERRWEVIEYAQNKYGMDRVANILNFVRYKGRNSLDDIARVYLVPDWKIENIKARLVERNEGHPRFSDTLQDTIDGNTDIADLVEKTPELQLATKLEGNYRNSSIHPAGIIISSVPLDQICATYEKQSGKERGHGVAYDKKDSEYLGLLKLDFLSLRALTGIRATLDAIGMTIDQFYAIPLDDPKVYEAFRAGDALGIFQFEGHTTRRVLKLVAPTKFMDLSDVNALARPGGDDKAYLRNKNLILDGQDPLADVHPIVFEHLHWTFGTIVYQEQILLILRDLGNFAPAETNRIRKAISAKQDATVFNAYQQQFVDGAATHGMDSDDAQSVWNRIVASADYSFNISHSVSYSDTAYRQMWLKVHHKEFYLGQLLKCPDDDEGKNRRRKLIIEANQHGIPVKPPSLDHSQANWALVDGVLYAGFTAIKGIGPRVADAIVDWRINRHQVSLSDPEQFWAENPLEWEKLGEISGIGPGRIETIRAFCESDDPFGVLRVQRILDSVRLCFRAGEFPGVPEPTHCSKDINQPDELVVYMGILKAKTYKDIVTQRLKYGNQGASGTNTIALTKEDVLDDLTDPHLLKYAVLDVEDEFDEPIRIRISRKKFPQYQGLIRNARINQDIIVAKGYVSEFGGLAIQVKEMVVIDPE